MSLHGPQTVKKGESLVLSCNATSGKTEPQDITWVKDNNNLLADKTGRVNITTHISYVTHTIISNLTIKKIVKEDEGTYECRSSDEMVKNMTIEVEGEGAENVKSKLEIALKIFYFPITILVPTYYKCITTRRIK